MNIEIVSVTPEMAKQWLDTNAKNNRKLRKGIVARYASDMIKNRWQVTGEAIKFAVDGRLIDGQHRLNAVLLSKKTIQVAVVRGLPADAMKVLDTGQSRSAGDALTIFGHNGQSAVLAGLARKVIATNAGTTNVMGVKKIRIGADPITTGDIVDYCQANDLSPYVRFGIRMDIAQVAKIFTATEWSYVFWLLCQKSETEANDFLTRLATLEDVSKDSPIRVLFDKIVKSSIKLDSKMKLSATIQTWNCIRSGQPLTKLRVGEDSSIPKAQ